MAKPVDKWGLQMEESEASLLPRDSGEGDSEYQFHRRKAPTSTRPLINCVLALSLTLNAVLSVLIYLSKTRGDACISEFTGLGYNATSVYEVSTGFTHPNDTIADEHWETLTSSPIVVALDADYVRDHDLEPSIPFPWDQSRGLYHVKAFHHIHCLKNVRRAYLDALEADPSKPKISPRHIAHCLDTIRQDIMCNADDTPMPTIQQPHKIGNGQARKCKDWDALTAWTQAPERQSCFHMIDEYRPVTNSLEEFAYCPKGSPYTPTMERYFERWGHKDPFGEVKEAS